MINREDQKMNRIKKVLIIDDEEQILRQLEKAISKKGYGVYLARNGNEGLEYLKKGNYPIIITDLRMPEGPDGLEVLKEMRRRRPDSYVVILTGHGDKEDAIKALNLEAFRYIEKGSSTMLEDLLNIIDIAFERYKIESPDLDFLSFVEDISKKSDIESVRRRTDKLPFSISKEIIRQRNLGYE